MIKMSRKAKKAMAVALTAGMLASTAVTPVMAATQGWTQNSKGWWYQNADGTYPANKWSQINGKWYYFDANGYMLANKWVKDSAGKWYYVGKSGAMLTNAWVPDKNGLWYWVTDNGSMFEGGWGHINGEWYFFQNDGVMQSGVVKVDGKTYYLGAPSEGWMHTGIVTVEGAEYNFDETNGHCTSQKVPATTKKFDGKGTPIEDKIDIEEVDGITTEVVSALPQYKDYGNVVMAGSNVTIKVKVSNNGEPVVGTYVTLSLKCKNSNDASYKADTYVAQTSVGGYATFLVRPKEDTMKATSKVAEYYTYTVTSAINDAEETEGNFAIAYMNIPDITVNPTGADDKLEMSDNAQPGDKGQQVVTTAMDGSTKIKYVKSQQVSLPNQTEHKVTFEINPEVVIPTGEIKKVTSDYKQEVNKTLSEYSVYEEQEFWIEDIPAGLQYATLNFENIDISEHTKVEIKAFKADKETSLPGVAPTYIDGPTTQKSLGQQIPILQEEKVAIRVKVISQGQVNDGQNGGLTIKDVVGVYKQEGVVETVKIPYTNPVTWEQTKIEYSLSKDLSFEGAGKYIPNDSKYYVPTYKYSYQVPVFPFVGNAIITVKDSNNEVVAYFTTPTVNETKSGTTNKYNNVNVLDDTVIEKAILVTKDEAFNNVGTITPNGNRVTVNSSETGTTALRAKITIDSEELDLTNNVINTSVQWSPIPSVAEENDFYALSGQKIVVKAQLVDKSGNKVSKSEEAINFFAGGTLVKEGDIDDNGVSTKVTALQIADKTDSEGCAKLVVQATNTQALLASLTADAENKKYDVILHIGDEKVESANLRWVTPGLTFNPSVNAATDEDLNTIEGRNTADGAFIEKYLTKEAGSNWIIGFKANGDTQDDDDDKERWVSSIEGLKINLSQDGEANLVTDGMKNGAAKVSTTKASSVKVTGEIDETSVVAGTPITFDVYTHVNGAAKPTHKVYTNVGEGDPIFDEEVALTLPVLFGTVGTNMSIELPKGDNIDALSPANEKVYVKVLDAYGNAKEGKLKKVTITYTDINGERVTKVTEVDENGTFTKNEVKGPSSDSNPSTNSLKDINSDGFVAVEVLREISGTKVKKAEIKAEYDNQSATATINFVAAKDQFLLLNANYDEDSKKATVTFSQNLGNLQPEMIKVTNNNTNQNVTVTDVKVKDGNKVEITFKNALKDDYTYTVRIADGVDVDEDGIPETLCDKFGRSLDNDNKTTVLTVEAADLVATYNFTSDSDSEVDFEINGVAGADIVNGDEIKILCVYEGGFAIATADTGFDINDIAGDGSNVSLPDDVTEVKFYYSGAVKTVKLTERNAAVNAAKSKIAAATVASTPATGTYSADELFSFADLEDAGGRTFRAVSVTLDDNDGGIFDSIENANQLKIANPAIIDTATTATVTVTYADSVYPSVTRKITYDVTLPTSSTIKFEEHAD